MAKFQDLGISNYEIDRQLRPYAEVLVTLSELRLAGFAGKGQSPFPNGRGRSLSDLKRQGGRINSYRFLHADQPEIAQGKD